MTWDYVEGLAKVYSNKVNLAVAEYERLDHSFDTHRVPRSSLCVARGSIEGVLGILLGVKRHLQFRVSFFYSTAEEGHVVLAESLRLGRSSDPPRVPSSSLCIAKRSIEGILEILLGFSLLSNFIPLTESTSQSPPSTPGVPWLLYSPLDPRFAGSNPPGVNEFFHSVKIPSMSSFRRVVKPLVPCRIFTAHKRTSSRN